ncbi:MAG: hypothetical protein IT198_11770 [Acidimicrobiia bacterium]|nr:hypothetical protein [Acidimicrobiia bacterium]
MISLPDVNVLVALAWPNHVHHRAAVEWFRAARGEGWATSPLTESGFVRVSSNHRVIPTARTPLEAIEVLRRLRGLADHRLWTDDVSLTDCPEIDVDRLVGYRQVTDAHVLTLAIRNGGRVVTFDRAVRDLATDPDRVLILRA